MSILEELMKEIEKYWHDFDLNLEIERIQVGIHFTICILNDNSTGVCHNVYSEKCEADLKIDVNGKNLQYNNDINKARSNNPLEVSKLSFSDDIIKKVIGISCINAISQHLLFNYEFNLKYSEKKIAGLDFNSINSVGFIGAIVPTMKKLAKTGIDKIFLRENDKSKIPENIDKLIIKEDLDFVEEIEVLLITGSSLANDTIDNILDLSSNCKEVVLIGPTASCIPEPLFNEGLTRIAGMRLMEPNKVCDVIMKGGGTRQFKKFGRKYYIKKN
ncbi:MAG: hypothetical protein EU547_00470 [Promethearchaeota archaeon]|nr:MAG: hypothetical protein EU547_00470 [Candidatus Lokiarchaeota archaeon]